MLVLCVILLSEAGSSAQAPPPPPKDGKTDIQIGEPKYIGLPNGIAKVPITVEIHKDHKMLATTITIETGIFGTLIPYAQTPYTPPEPGKGPVTFNIIFDVNQGSTYNIRTHLAYYDAKGKQKTVSTAKEIKP